MEFKGRPRTRTEPKERASRHPADPPPIVLIPQSRHPPPTFTLSSFHLEVDLEHALPWVSQPDDAIGQERARNSSATPAIACCSTRACTPPSPVNIARQPNATAGPSALPAVFQQNAERGGFQSDQVPPSTLVAPRRVDRQPGVFERIRHPHTLPIRPAKSKPSLPHFASVRDSNRPATRRSTWAFVVCQSTPAAFRAMIASGAT